MSLFANLELALPGRLLLLVLLPAVVWLALVGRKEKALGQRLASAALRCLVVALLCFAWAVPSWRGTSERRFVVFVQDTSASAASSAAEHGEKFVEQAIAARGSHQVRSIQFAASPTLLQSREAGEKPAGHERATDIAAAITLAQSICPNDYVPQIVLQSDGLETHHSALAAAISTRVPISTVPLAPLASPEIAVDRLEVPASAASQESFDIVATLTANQSMPATVTLLRDDVMVAVQRIDLMPGETIWRKPLTLADRQHAVFKVVIAGERDTVAENNSLQAVVVARAPAKVLVVDGDPHIAAPLVATLRQFGYDAQALRPNELPTADAELQEVKLVLLRDVPASSLGPQRQAALDRYVRGGGGLLVVGGENSFGAQAYQLTGLEKMLPVVATAQPEEQQRSLALVLVVDKSLSMKDENRFELAKAAARRVVDVLSETDQVGVVAFGDESEWVSRLAPLADKAEVLARIDRLEASGLTNMYPAIARAYLALSQADADSRYAILLTDGVPTPGDFGEIARKMADAGITISTVSISAGADQTILKDIARIARGNHHHVNNPAELPKILEGETRTAVSQVAPSETTALAQRKFPGLDVATAPTITGFVTTKFKPTAQVLLVAGEGDPLVAWWRYGRGVAMVVTADLVGAGGERWRAWPGNEAFWRTLTRHALRDEVAGNALDVREVQGETIVTLDAVQPSVSGATFINGADAKLTIESLSGEKLTSADMPQIAPGRYAATIATPRDAVVLRARLERDGKPILDERRGFAPRYAEEFRLRPADEAKLKMIAAATGGKFNPDPSSVFAPDGRQVEVLHPLFSYFLIAALLVYLADVAVRRMPAARSETSNTKYRIAA